MTCNSCVQSIEGQISTVSGVQKVEVSLEEKEGKITFLPRGTSGIALVSAIEDMGFESTLKRIVKILNQSEVPVGDEEEKALGDETVTIAVHGMTCQSCVKSIEGRVSGMEGVKAVNVSLEGKQAVIQYSPQFTNPLSLKNEIEDCGFEAFLPSSRKPELKSTSIGIEGMTCNSCVQTIEKNIGECEGVDSVSVSLKDKKADILYSPGKITPEQLRDAIDDVGFEAKLLSEATENADHLCQTTSISIEGMTCMSCVKSIEGTVGTKPGVKKIKVSLEDKEALVEYDPGITTSEDVRGAIEDMGFEAALLDSGNKNTDLSDFNG